MRHLRYAGTPLEPLLLLVIGKLIIIPELIALGIVKT